MSSPSHSVLAVQELLSRILELLDDEDYASTALVCKAWSEESLNIFWDDATSAKAPTLFKLLAPIVKSSDDLLMFKRPLRTKDWSRFDKYAMRVRRLGCSPQFMDRIDPSFWLEICSSKLRRFVFPNLRALWCSPQPAIISFLAPSNLMSMTLVGLGVHFTPVNMVYSLVHLRSRMKYLQSLTLAIDESEFEKLHAVLPKILPSFSHIHHLNLSQEYLTSAVTKVLASFPHLKTLSGDPQNGLIVQTSMFPASLKVGSFPSLESLSVYTSFSDITPCLPRMGNLVHLTLDSVVTESAEVYAKIIQVAANSLLKLETFDLTPGTSSLSSAAASEHIKFSALKPILALHRLKRLVLRHYYGFDLHSDDVVSLLQALRHLEELQLNPCPVSKCAPTLDAATLINIVPYCPRLKTLGLYLEMRAVNTVSPSALTEAGCLPSLLSFVYGASRVASDDTVLVAAFLSLVLPKGCKLYKKWQYDHAGSGEWGEVISLLREVGHHERDP